MLAGRKLRTVYSMESKTWWLEKMVPSDPELEAGPFFDALAKDIWALIQEHNLKAEQMRESELGCHPTSCLKKEKLSKQQFDKNPRFSGP